MADSEAKWYVIHTYQGYENKVASDLLTAAESRNLQDRILETKVPTEIVVEKVQKVDKKTQEVQTVEKEVEQKLYPSYVFVKAVYDDDIWSVFRNTRGFTGFVGPGSKPVPLTDEEAERMGVEVYSEGSATVRNAEIAYKEGDSVSIIEGPFKSYVGMVDKIDIDKNYVRVVMSMFGRETPVELELDQVEPIEY